MIFTFHKLYVIIGFEPSTVISWTELTYWRKGYSNKAALLLVWSHCYKKSQYGWPLRNIHIKHDNGLFSFLHSYFPFLYHRLHIRITRRVCHKKQELLTIHEHPGSLQVYGKVHVAHLRFLCYVVLICFVCLRPVSCVPNGLSILDCPFGFL
jgi:hypothetical protein